MLQSNTELTGSIKDLNRKSGDALRLSRTRTSDHIKKSSHRVEELSTSQEAFRVCADNTVAKTIDIVNGHSLKSDEFKGETLQRQDYTYGFINCFS